MRFNLNFKVWMNVWMHEWCFKEPSIPRSNHPKVFCRMAVLKMFQKLTVKHVAGLQLCCTKDFTAKFPINVSEFLKIARPWNYSKRKLRSLFWIEFVNFKMCKMHNFSYLYKCNAEAYLGHWQICAEAALQRCS